MHNSPLMLPDLNDSKTRQPDSICLTVHFLGLACNTHNRQNAEGLKVGQGQARRSSQAMSCHELYIFK